MWAADRWLGEDKLTHGTYCYAGALTFRLLGLGIPLVVAIVSLVGIAVEVVQWVRKRQGKTTFAHEPSYRDLAWNTAGLILGLFMAWVTT